MPLLRIVGFSFCFFLLQNNLLGQEPRLVLPLGHTADINTVVFNSAGTRIVTSSDDNTAKIWDAETGELLIDLNGHSDYVVSAVFSPDDSKILTASQDITAKIWDANTGKLLFDLTGHKNWVNSAFFSPDGRRIVTASKDGSAKIWDANTGKLLIDLNQDSIWAVFAFFSPDGKKFFTASPPSVNSTTGIWDVETGKLIVRLKGFKGEAASARFSPNGKNIIAILYDNSVEVWDADSGNLIHKLKGHSDHINSARFSPDGKRIITASSDGTARIWDILSGNIFRNLGSNTLGVESAEYSPDNKYIVTSSLDGIVRIWDIESGKLKSSIEDTDGRLISACYSLNNKKIITVSDNHTAKIWDAVSGKLLHNLNGHVSQVQSARYNHDGSLVITAGDSAAKIWDSKTGNLLKRLQSNIGPVKSARYSFNGEYIIMENSNNEAVRYKVKDNSFYKFESCHTDLIDGAEQSPDGKYFVSGALDINAKVYDETTCKVLRVLKGHTGLIQSAFFSPDGRFIITASNDSTARIWDAVSGKLLRILKEYNGQVIYARYGPGSKYIVTVCSDRNVKVRDAVSGKLLLNKKWPADWSDFPQFSPDGKHIVVIGKHDVKIWSIQKGLLEKSIEVGLNSDLRDIDFVTNKLLAVNNFETEVYSLFSGKRIYRFVSIDSVDHISILPNGFYQATQNAAKLLHYVTKDLKVITFEQLDVKYNRPDKVLEAIGNTDTALIKSYRKAWEKRIKKLGIDTTAFRDGYSVPECDFVNRDAIEYEQKNDMLQLQIKGTDSTYKLDRFNVWVNESPLYGQRGISIKRKNSNSIDTTITIKISQGENRIETSITNVNGTESYRMPLYVNYTQAVKQKEKLRFIGIGIDKFADSKNNLQYSSKDIRDLATKLKEKYKDDIIIDTLFNENVTIEKVKALKQKLQQTTVNDKVIISYSGHGLLSKDYDYYLSTYSINFDKPEENGLPYEELENLLDSIPARKKLMLIDACHSGEVDKEEMVRITNAEDSLSKQGTKGGKPTYTGKTTLGMKNSFELMQSLFVNVGKSTGATIISAAAGTQFALERNDLKNGVFTYCILEAMDKNPTMKISELKKIVGERVEQLTNGLQKPTSRNETIAVDWSLW